MYDCNTGEILLSRLPTFKREVASITKMMTFLTVIRLMERFGMNQANKIQIKVSKVGSKVIGTTANLQENDILSVEQLFYGMMLPSGNDAAFGLAEYFGSILKERKYNKISDDLKLPPNSQFNGSNVKYFLKEMNLLATKLKMHSTFYDSPHGLMNKNNYSTASDVTLLIAECMKIDVYRRVVSTKVYETKALCGSPKDGNGAVTFYHWENSNKLLGVLPGILGCKTGITNAAGPCFAGYYENKEGTVKLAMVLCHSKTLEHRWDEITAMVEWYKKKYEIK